MPVSQQLITHLNIIQCHNIMMSYRYLLNFIVLVTNSHSSPKLEEKESIFSKITDYKSNFGHEKYKLHYNHHQL
jgi:hypothetical protein